MDTAAVSGQALVLHFPNANDTLPAGGKQNMRLLLVEDNRPLSEWLKKTLHHGRYNVDCAYTGMDADHLLLTQPYDLVILDLGLPRMEGREVLRRLRARDNNVPVLILTANNSMEGRVRSLDDGADDYIAKPFEVVELEARIRALLRRATQHANPVSRYGMLGYDSNTRIFSLGPTALTLTPREHAVLEILFTKLGKTVSKQSIAAKLSSLDEDVSEDAIEIYVHYLRKKLDRGDVSIVTLRGLGYLLKQRDEN
jgi:two-component system response regulator TctD